MIEPNLIHITPDMSIPCPPVKCPECGGETYIEIEEWETETGIPTEVGVMLRCRAEEEEFERACERDEDPEWEHRWWQGEWQPAIDEAVRYAQHYVRVASAPAPMPNLPDAGRPHD